MSGEETVAPKVSRRTFLKLIGTAAALYAAKRLGVTTSFAKNEQSQENEPKRFSSEKVSGVDVYGLKENVSSARDVSELYQELDDEFVRNNNIRTEISGPNDLIKLQKEVLNPNERYLEVVVRRSAYNSFEQKKNETGVDFPGWIKMHVDLLNRCLDEAQPNVDMKAVLRRVIVVEDKCAESFWNEQAYRSGTGNALDVAWDRQFWPPAVDTDASWAIADDYRNKDGAYFYNVRNNDGKVVLEKYFAGGNIKKSYELQNKNDSLNGKDNVLVDMGLLHEWSHRLLNLPDEYSQNVSDSDRRFTNFEFATGSFTQPAFSPYLSYVLQENIKLKARNMYDSTSNRGQVFNEHPENVRIAACFEDMNFNKPSVGITAVRLLEGSYYGRKEVPASPDQRSGAGPIDLSNDFFNLETNCWLVRAEDGKKVREVFLPAAALNMSKIVGLKSAEYDIVFSGHDDPDKKGQEVKLVDKKDVVGFHYDQKNPVYAEMKVPGTDSYLMWFLKS